MVTVLRLGDGPPAGPFSDLQASGWTPASSDTIWLDLEAPTADELRILREPFRFHPLAIDDCLTPEHHPKVEDFGNHLFLIARGIDFNAPGEEFQTVKLASFIGPNYLVTYHRCPLRSVAAVRDKYAGAPEAAPANRGPAHLLYEILDHLLDYYFPVLDAVEQDLDTLEEAVLEADRGARTLDRLLATRRRVVEIRRAIAPHREVFTRVSRSEFEAVGPTVVAFYRDLYDSVYRLTEEADTYRELLGGALEAYLSMISQRLNEVMKVLTIFATILLPLTFIVGVYGMNFAYMPELGWRYGYFAVWGLMVAVAGGLLWLIRRKGWL